MYTITTEKGRTDGCEFVSFITDKEVQRMMEDMDDGKCYGNYVISRNNNWVFEVYIASGGFRCLRKGRATTAKMEWQNNYVVKAHHDNDSMFGAYSDYLADVLPGVYPIKFIYYRKDYSSLHIVLDCGVEFSFRVLTEDGQLTNIAKTARENCHPKCDDYVDLTPAAKTTKTAKTCVDHVDLTPAAKFTKTAKEDCHPNYIDSDECDTSRLRVKKTWSGGYTFS